MHIFGSGSIQRKQTLIIMMTCGVALLLACVTFAVYEVLNFRHAMVRELHTLAGIVGNNSTAGLDFSDPKQVEETLSALQAEPNLVAACVYTRESEPFAIYQNARSDKPFLPPAVQMDRHYFSDESLHLFSRIIHKGEFIGTVYLQSDLKALYARLQRYVLIVAGVFAAASSVALFLSSRLQRIISAPILQLVQTARSVTQQRNYSMRAAKRSNDELGVLVDSFNEMLAQIQMRDGELREAKDALERRVEERTRELQSEVLERRRTEAELLKAKEAAESATRAKSDFLASMSHEIRTPMNGVIGMLGLLHDGELSDRQREFAQIARTSADSLLGIINDILDFSKIEAGKLTIEPLAFDLQAVVEEVGELFAPKVAEKQLDLVIRYAPESPRHVIGDPGRVRQVLINLVGNAVKFTATGHVLIDVQCESGTDGPARLRLSVQDTGIGIPEDKLKHIFEKFTQADASTTRRFGGTGLGLAISKQLVELMGGRFGVISQPGQGSTFWFLLPLSVPDAMPAIAPLRANLEGVRVLVVDDNTVNRRVLLEQTATWQMRSDGCASAEEALARLREALGAGDPYHIAVLDDQMPGMSGEGLARAIKADPALQETVLVMLTSGRQADAKRLRESGIFACLVKPARQSKVRDVLAAAWEARTIMSATQLLRRAAVETPKIELRTSRKTHARVLVADDNTTNQRVARLMLENLGCRVDVAANGKEAIEMLALLPYDVAFMDCEMPETDGYEATAEIRRRHPTGRRLPIIAMTAKAIQGDRERCLRAGMDDYISKPVRLEDLEEALKRWVPNGQNGVQPDRQIPRGTETGPEVPPLDPAVTDRLRGLAVGDPSVLDEIYQSYLTSAVEYLHELHKAAKAEDADALAKVAHAFKGASGNVGATNVMEICRQLELLGNARSVAGAKELLGRLEGESARVKGEIETQVLTASSA